MFLFARFFTPVNPLLFVFSPSLSDELLAPFVALDANGDGYITRKEYRNGSENGSLNKVFERIDTNEDRRISKEEFRFHRTMVANAGMY